MMCVALAHHTLARDWYNISLTTIPDPEWLVHSVLCVIDSSQQANAASLCILLVKVIFHQITDLESTLVNYFLPWLNVLCHSKYYIYIVYKGRC